jgi:hypothetical protein
VHDPAQDVSAQIVGAQTVRPAEPLRGHPRFPEDLQVGVHGCQGGSERAHQEQEHDERSAHDELEAQPLAYL